MKSTKSSNGDKKVFNHSYYQILTILFTLLATQNVFAGFEITPAPPNFSKAFDVQTIGPNSTTTLVFTIDNTINSLPVTDLAFIDTLPANVTIADPALPTTDCGTTLDSTLTAPNGGSTITFSDYTVGGFSTCSVVVNVTSNVIGTHSNNSGDLTSNAGNSGAATADLIVDISLIGFSKEFSPSIVAVGDRSTLTFTLNNESSGAQLGSFTDNLPTSIVVADPPNASHTCFSGSIIAEPGSNTINFPSVILFPLSACTATVDVLTTGSGLLHNISSQLITVIGNDGFDSGFAVATLEATVTPIALRKSFVDDPVPPGDTVELEFQIENLDRTFSATGIAFNDVLSSLVPTIAGLTFDSLIANDCGGSVTGAGTSTINLTGGTLAAESSCTIRTLLSVNASATPGIYKNTTDTISATVDGLTVDGNMASDSLFVEPIPLITKTFKDNPVNPGDTTELEFTISNTSTTSDATDITFIDKFNAILMTASSLPASECCGTGSVCEFEPFSDVFPEVPISYLSITGGSLAQNGVSGDSCTFSITLEVDEGAPAGNYPIKTSNITATVDGDTRIGKPAEDTLTVVAAPSLSKSFIDDPVAPSGSVTLEFTLNYSPDASGDATAITFTDDLSTLFTGLTANFPPTPNPPCGASSTFTGSVGDTLLTLVDASLSPGGSCTFSVTLDVPSDADPGTYTNTTSSVSATVDGVTVNSGPASDDLDVTGVIFTKEFIANPVLAGQTTNLQYTVENIHPTDDATIVLFLDNLGGPPSPSSSAGALVGLAAAAVGVTTTNTCGGTLSGTTNLFYIGGTALPSGQTCTIAVDIVVPPAAPDGSYPSVSGNLVVTQSGGSVNVFPASDDLVVESKLLVLTKNFINDPVAPGDTVTMELVLNNIGTSPASSIAFSDDLDAALSGLIAQSLNSNECAFTIGGVGTDNLTFSDGALAASSSCTTSIELLVPLATIPSTYTNTTSSISGMISGFPVYGDATSDELVIQGVSFSKSFTPSTVVPGELTTLNFSITNDSATEAVSGMAFFDDLNSVIAGLSSTASFPINDVCGSGSQLNGPTVLTLIGANLPANGNCSIDIELLVPLSSGFDTFTNTSSALTINGLSVAESAIAFLTVYDDDLDDDGVLNEDDNCPNNANAGQADLDDDGQGDVCDSDIDGDGMPNSFETANGLDPRDPSDKNGDLDGDGFTNLEEFKFGTDPNSPNQDNNGNGVPDIVDERRKAIIPAIISPLLLDGT